jgi:hypothetical protein
MIYRYVYTLAPMIYRCVHTSANDLSICVHTSANDLSICVHTSANDLSICVHTSANDLSICVHTSANDLSICVHTSANDLSICVHTSANDLSICVHTSANDLSICVHTSANDLSICVHTSANDLCPRKFYLPYHFWKEERADLVTCNHDGAIAIMTECYYGTETNHRHGVNRPFIPHPHRHSKTFILTGKLQIPMWTQTRLLIHTITLSLPPTDIFPISCKHWHQCLALEMFRWQHLIISSFAFPCFKFNRPTVDKCAT